jgi:hypothetical protein
VPTPLRSAALRTLADERRALHLEGLLAVAATVALVGAAGLSPPLLALTPAALLYAAMTVGWVSRYVGVLGRDCPRCGELFFFSLQRLLYSLPYLSTRCAHCDESLAGSRPPRS